MVSLKLWRPPPLSTVAKTKEQEKQNRERKVDIRVCGLVLNRKLRGYRLKQGVRYHAEGEEPQTRSGATSPTSSFTCLLPRSFPYPVIKEIGKLAALKQRTHSRQDASVLGQSGCFELFPA